MGKYIEYIYRLQCFSVSTQVAETDKLELVNQTKIKLV